MEVEEPREEASMMDFGFGELVSWGDIPQKSRTPKHNNFQRDDLRPQSFQS